ncbi:hypothetical protein FACS1894137_10130 [Spirochaetia bacterium]|nr:hypothetical protein FACS1894137_10130 [Spirochaetia bacterium]
MDTKIQQLKSIVYELDQLHTKARNHIDEQVSAEKYVYSNVYRGWVSEYNHIVQKYNQLTSANLASKNISDYELSSTQKTVRADVAISFAQAIKELAERIDSEISLEQNKETPIPPYQMRICFKTGARGCPLNPVEKKSKVFVAMPFGDEYKDSYEYGVKLALAQKAMEHFKADNEISNKDIWCKICKEIQLCGKVIANISGLNPNVMLELGLAYGLGKEVIVIKDKKTTTITDLGSIEYIEYAHAGELQQTLFKIL